MNPLGMLSSDQARPTWQVTGARVVLGVALSGMALALGWVLWFGESPIGSLVFFEYGWPATETLWLQRSIACVLGLCVAGLWMPAAWLGASFGRLSAMLIGLVLLEKAYAQVVLGGALFSDWTLFAAAAAWCAPLGWIALSFGRVGLAVWILRLAAATTFFVHGCEALAQSPHFMDLVLIADLRWAEFSGAEPLMEAADARSLLTLIGVVDLVVAVGSLVVRSRALWTYMAAWGFLTAASRMAAGGFDWWHLSFERLANGGVPLALVLIGVAELSRARDHEEPRDSLET